MSAADSPASVTAAMRWWQLNTVRHVLTLTAWLATLKALTLVGR